MDGVIDGVTPPATPLSAYGRSSRKRATISGQHVRGSGGPQIIRFRHAEIRTVGGPLDHTDARVAIRVEQRIALNFRVVAAVVNHQVLGAVLGLGE